MFYKGPETLIISSTPKGTNRLEARASDPACWLFKAYECNCGFLWLYNTLAIFGVNCLIKTQPQIGDFRLKNGKFSRVFIPPTFWPSRSPWRRRPTAAVKSQLTQRSLHTKTTSAVILYPQQRTSQLTQRSVLTLTTSAAIPYPNNVVDFINTFNNISSRVKEQETLDSAGPNGRLSNAKLDLTGLWDWAIQEDPVLASPSAQSGEPDRLVFNLL